MNENLRLLIVDDDRRMTRTLADILSLAGYETFEAWSAEQAVEIARTATFDCVLTDIRMPGMNGVELFRELRQMQPGLPVILMTAYASEVLIQQGSKEGVVGALDKPLDMRILLEVLSSLGKMRTVAVVDDDPSFCRTLGDILKLRGFSVITITDPHVDLAQEMEKADMILLDMKLNSIDGLDVLRQLRETYPTLPVLMITGYRQEMLVSIQKAMDLNAYACLYKPLAIPELLQKIGEIQTNGMKRIINAR